MSALGHHLTGDYQNTKSQQEAQREASLLTPQQLVEQSARLKAEMYDRRAKRQEGSPS